MPDLTGLFENQPGYVVIIVIALVVGGTLGLAYIRAKAGDPDEPAAPQVTPAEVAALASAGTAIPGPGSPGSTYDALGRAMDHLAEVARREATENEQARATNADLADRLERATRELAACERRAAGVVREAYLADRQQPLVEQPALGDGPADPPRRRHRYRDEPA